MQKSVTETPNPMESLLEAREVADWLKTAVSTVYDQAARGVLPHVRLWRGKRRTVIRFRREDIEKFLIERASPARTK